MQRLRTRQVFGSEIGVIKIGIRPNSKVLVVLNEAGTLQFFDENLEGVSVLSPVGKLLSFTFASESGTMFVGSDDGTVYHRNLTEDQNWTIFTTDNEEPIKRMRANADGSFLLLEKENSKIEIWDVENTFLKGEFGGLSGPVVDMEFVKNVNMVITATETGDIQKWSLDPCAEFVAKYNMGSLTWMASPEDGLCAAAFMSDGEDSPLVPLRFRFENKIITSATFYETEDNRLRALLGFNNGTAQLLELPDEAATSNESYLSLIHI